MKKGDVKMRVYNIRFESVAQINEFIGIVEKFHCPMDLSYGGIMVDAKSLIGVMAIGTHKILTLTVFENLGSAFENKIAAFRYDNWKNKVEYVV